MQRHRAAYAARMSDPSVSEPPVDHRRDPAGVVDTLRAALPMHPWQRWALAAIGAALLLVIAFREPLADRLWPEARAHRLSDQAAQALARGRLTAVDGTGARELYEAALAIDPDDGDARVGLGLVAQVALAQARSAIAVDDYAQAHQSLALARALSIPRAQADVVEARLRQRESRHAGIDGLLARAKDARAARRLEGTPDAALPLYARVLALQPDRVEALEGREDSLSDLLQQARVALQRGDLPEASRLIAIAHRYDPGHADLPDAQARLSTAIERLRGKADDALRHDRLDRAGDGFQALLRIDAADAGARHGIERVADAWAHRAERLAADFRFEEATAALGHARELSPDSAAVRDATRAIAHARQSKGRLAAPGSPAERNRRIAALLADAAAAQARGDLLTPPGDSAFDKLRAARAVDPANPAVRRASAQLLPAARDCFERELRANDLGRARVCLDARAALEGEGAPVAQARRRLAQRWLSVGEERLRAGALADAQHALDSARAIDVAAPGIGDFAARLATASASRR
jgi:tetratricopeptide (TPR) repeat protein